MVLEQDLSLINKVNRLLGWGHWFTFFNILLTLGVTASYFAADPLPTSAIGWLYLLMNWLGHTAFLCFLFFIITIFPVSLIFPSQRHVRGIGAVLATSGIVVLIFDAYVYHSLGYHAGSAATEQMLDLLRQQVVTNLRNFVLITSSVFLLLLAIELVISNFCWKKVERLKHAHIHKPALVVFLVAFVGSHVAHIWADAFNVQAITRQDNVLPFSYPTTARSLLARYEMLDPAQLQRSQSKGWLQQQGFALRDSTLSCPATIAVEPIQVWVVRQLSTEQRQLLQLQHFKAQSQFVSPLDEQAALANLAHGQLAVLPLQNHPKWLSSVSPSLWSMTFDPQWLQKTPWLATKPSSTALVQWFFSDGDSLTEALKRRPSASRMLVLELTGHSERFALGHSEFYYYWPELHQMRISQVTQSLDIVPTLLAYMGCDSSAPWVGDNLLAPVKQAKLNILGHQLYAFRKDKMLLVQEDGQFSVYSAGTEVPLESKPDWPMLTEALNRLAHDKINH